MCPFAVSNGASIGCFYAFRGACANQTTCFPGLPLLILLGPWSVAVCGSCLGSEWLVECVCVDHCPDEVDMCRSVGRSNEGENKSFTRGGNGRDSRSTEIWVDILVGGYEAPTETQTPPCRTYAEAATQISPPRLPRPTTTSCPPTQRPEKGNTTHCLRSQHNHEA